MPYPNSVTSYPDVQQLFDKALDSEKGLKLTFATDAEAVFNVGRFNAYRVRHRRENKKVYPADHEMHGNSPYDGLMIQRRGTIVVIRKLDIGQFNVETLSETNDPPEMVRGQNK